MLKDILIQKNTLIRIFAAKMILLFALLIITTSNTKSQETVYLHINKTVFISGELGFFKAYVRDLRTPMQQALSKILYLQVTDAYNNVLLNNRIDISNGTASGYIVIPDSLSSGIYTLSAYTNCMRNFPVKSMFHQKVMVINQNDEKCNSIKDYDIENTENKTVDSNTICKIELAKKIFSPREKVRLKLNLSTKIAPGSIPEASISVSQIVPGLAALHSNNMVSYISGITKALTTGEIVPEKQCRYPTEKQGFILEGKITANENKPNEQFVLLSTMDTIANLKIFKTKEDGLFYFLLDKFYDNKEIYIQLKDNLLQTDNYQLKIDDKTIGPKISNIREYEVSEHLKDYVVKSRKIALISKIYQQFQPDLPSVKTNGYHKKRLPFYGKPDQVVLPSDFETLENFEEISRNIASSVKLRKKNDIFRLKVLDEVSVLYPEKDAIWLVNNVPVFSYNLLEPLGSKKIKKMEIKKKQLFYGELAAPGVFATTLSQETAQNILLAAKIPVYLNKTMKNQDLYPFTNYENAGKLSTYLADFRQALYWQPHVVFQGQEAYIEFYTSDLKANYQINAEGTLPSGQVFSVSETIEVKP
jgi:hypothetical protein